MAKFRKKPSVIEAVQYKLPITTEMKDFLNSGSSNYFGINHRLYLETSHGEYKVGINEWIIKDVNNELYTCEPDIFETTYDLVES